MLNIFKPKHPNQTPPQTKAVPLSNAVTFHGNGRPIWSGRDTQSLTRNGFAANPIGFRCVKMIAESVAAIPMTLYTDGARLDTHPVLSLLSRPNSAQGHADFMENLIGQLLLTGNGYVEASDWDENALPKQLYVLRSDRMRIIPGADGWPVAYEYRVGAKTYRFDVSQAPEPILHIKSFHPTDDHYGMSPMQPAATALDVHSAACKWSKSLLDNAARPSGAIIYKGVDGQSGLGSEQYNRLLDEIETNHSGAINAGRPMLLEGGLDWKQIGFSPSDMEFQKTKESAAREIALAFGVPPMLLGLPGDNTFANYAEANRAFYRMTVLPLIGKLAGSLSNWINRGAGEDVHIRADLDAIPALATERDAYWRRISEAGFLTDDEKRALLGLAVNDE